MIIKILYSRTKLIIIIIIIKIIVIIITTIIIIIIITIIVRGRIKNSITFCIIMHSSDVYEF